MYLVTGSAGHLGEAILRLARDRALPAMGLDIVASPYTDIVANITDSDAVTKSVQGVTAVLHCATLHKPHVATHSRQAFVDTNITGTLTLLDAARQAGVGAFVFASTTSTFGAAMSPAPDIPDAPAVWVDETLTPMPKNIYGVTKCAAEDLVELSARRFGLPGITLRLSRFFPEPDDDPERRESCSDANAKANELLYRRVDIRDAAEALLLAAKAAPRLKFDRMILSAPTRLRPDHLPALRKDPAGVVADLYPEMPGIFDRLGWRMFPDFDRVYDSRRAQTKLGWTPTWDFAHAIAAADRGDPPGSDLARAVGTKGYHGDQYRDGLYPTEAAPPPSTQA